MSWWQCRHPLAFLAVQKPETVEVLDIDFTRVTYHLMCQRCGAKDLLKRYAKLNGGATEFLNRGKT